ncbi:MAG TPA: hypothetical protein VGD79_09035 [Thermoanaerobaculia bacterium]|jgi:hypothetical protein
MGALLDRVRTRLFGTPDLQPTDVTDELRGAGTAFSTLIEGVGKAVALTTQELDQTAGHIATEMAKLRVNTVQAVVSSYGDDGNLQNVSVISGETSALSLATPPMLRIENVHIEARFTASEMSTTSTSNVNVNLVGVSVGSRGFGMRGPSASASVANLNTNLQAQQTEDSSVGEMSMTATIRPKPVRALAKPPLILKGPTLAMTVEKFLPVVATVPQQPNDPPFLERRGVVIKVQLKSVSGGVVPAPQQGSMPSVAIDCGTLDWEVTDAAGTSASGGPVPDATTGIFYVTVTRTVTTAGDAKRDFVLRAAWNLVHATLSVSV